IVDDPVDLRKEQKLVPFTRVDSGKRRQKIHRVVDLSLGQTIGQEQRTVGRAEKILILESSQAGEIAFLLVVAEKEEQPVFYDRAADGAAPLLTNVVRFDRNSGRTAARKENFLECKRVACSVAAVAVVIEKIAVKFVGTAFGNSVN